MKDLRALFFTVLGILIFIAILPALMWLFVILLILIAIFVIYSRYKINKIQKDMSSAFQEENQRNENIRQTYGDEKDDIIDVEYSESDDES